MESMLDNLFDLGGRVAVITGGGGLLGPRHAEAIARHGGVPVLVDVRLEAAERWVVERRELHRGTASAFACDITSPTAVEGLLADVLARYGRVDVLLNNAANNPKVEAPGEQAWSRPESFPLEQWDADLAVGLTGAFLCARAFGGEMARRGKGSIINFASYLGILAPEPRLYHRDGLSDAQQPVKPISYTVVKSGILGLTRYLAAYWGERGVRVNAITPGGVYNGQDPEFVQKLSRRIPMGRMAEPDELGGAVVFLASDASSYVTGANVVVDGGRVCW